MEPRAKFCRKGWERSCQQYQEGFSECLVPELGALEDDWDLPDGQTGRENILGRRTGTDSFLHSFILSTNIDRVPSLWQDLP